MKKTKFLVAMIAFICGAGAAISVNGRSSHSSTAIYYDWIDWNGNVVFYGMTQAEAQDMCVPAAFICLRAKQNVSVYTTGTLPWR